jgi:hypothetical protein
MVGRPKKYKTSQMIAIYVDSTDLKFCDDQRGKIGRAPFLMDCMYIAKGDHEKLREKNEEITRLKKELYEANQKLFFLESKSKTQIPHNQINESELLKFYKDNDIEGSITRRGMGPNGWNFENIFNKNIAVLASLVPDGKAFGNWCEDHYRKSKVAPGAVTA